jgi:hypothetical protein
MKEEAHHKGRNTTDNYLSMLLLCLEVCKQVENDKNKAYT